jgi:serine/threonine protein kinase
MAPLGAPQLEPVAAAIALKLGLTELQFYGQGAFKETFRARNPGGDLVALKVLDRSKCNIVRTKREIEAAQRCDSPRIAKIKEFGQHIDSQNQPFDYVIEEFFAGGTLHDRLAGKTMPVDQVKKMGLALCEALAVLQQLRLVHRDIKPENIMFRDAANDPVLVDFGLVRDLAQTSLTLSWLPQGPGTPLYSSPEQLNNEKGLIDWRSDQFSVGLVLGLFLTARHPFYSTGMTTGDIVDAILMRHRCSADFRAAATTGGCPFLIKMMAAWPVQRFSNPQSLIGEFKT